ncbi:MAG: LuxR C-terminal-related transcriptional regulator [Anaerolineae bacterium]|jgi:LuxR family maltose regulon positive regulatory protein
MTIPLLKTKLYVPPVRREFVARPRLIERLNTGLLEQGDDFARKLTLVSAPAGFGKTTLVSEWIQAMDGDTAPIAFSWLSLDENDNDPTCFLAYAIAALQTIKADVANGVLSSLQSPQPPPAEAVLTGLINEIAALSGSVVLALDDYHLIESQSIHDALTFLLRRLPPNMHLVIATREDPPLPLARLRARGHLTELRAADLRFTSSEAAELLNQAMELDLSPQDVAVLERRTEGWIAGLQLAAVSVKGRKDASGFIESFTGSHRFVLDYLLEEVLQQQSEAVQAFLLQTSILDRLTGPLCDAVRFGSAETPTGQDIGQATLEYLDQANLFIVPLDDERRWYRYHHLFADLLRLRLQQNIAASAGDGEQTLADYHRRASAWYEEQDLAIEALRHAAAANDIDRAERLVEGDGVPLSLRGALTPVLNWLASLPTRVLDARPALWVAYAMTSLAVGQTASVEEKLQAAEAALQDIELDEKSRDLVGRIAGVRANLAVGHRQVEAIITQSHRALDYLHPDNLTFRTATTWTLGVAYEFQGDRAAAGQAFREAIAMSEASGDLYTRVLALTGLANVQRAENQLHLAAETYRHVLHLVDDVPIPVDTHVHLCLARIYYEWNELDAARRHGEQSLQLAELFKDQYDISVSGEVFLARLKLAEGDAAGAAVMLAKAEQSARQHNFVAQIPEVAAAQVLTLLRQGNLATAVELADQHKLPISQARVHLAQANPPTALALLEPLRRQAEAKGWQDEWLKVMVLQAVALHALGEKDEAIQLLGDTLELAEREGFVRIFFDEGRPMARLLYEALSRGNSPDYVRRLLAAFPVDEPKKTSSSKAEALEFDLIESLSERELEVLQLVAAGLTNREIAARLYLSPNTVKVHTRNIYGKLGVNNRTQAAARGRALGILSSD